MGNSKYSNEEVDSVLAIYESKFTADTLSSLNRYLYVSALYTAGLNAIKNRKEKSAFEIFTKAHSIRPDDTLVTESLAMTAKIIEDQRKFKIRK
ncbi:MAG: hypothetical protein HYV28_05060 [Ignavibacteriales bacterium]|nr:hypothetical protein [Ignavibacteriales bacterium]